MASSDKLDHSAGQCTAAVATMVRIISTKLARRVPTPSTNNTGAINSAHIDNCQFRLTGNRLNGNGKFDWICANQFSPCHFSRPASKNSQARNRRSGISASHKAAVFRCADRVWIRKFRAFFATRLQLWTLCGRGLPVLQSASVQRPIP